MVTLWVAREELRRFSAVEQAIYVEAEKSDFTEACAYLDRDDVVSPWDGQLHPIVRV